MLDAYAVRKAIPRVLVAAIGINLSIYLCVAALDITKIVADSLNQLLVSPFLNNTSFEGIGIEGNFENSVLGVLGATGVLVSVMAALTSVAASAVSVLGLLLPLIITIALISLAVLFTLVVRQGLLVFLTITSPVALVLYVLPGTEKWFRRWADLFFRTLLVYPIIAAIFAMSNILGSILLKSANGGTANMLEHLNNFGQANNTSDAMGMIQILAAVIVLYAPLVLIPFSFKLAGGALAAVMNAAQSRASGIASRAGQAVNKSRDDPSSWLGSRRIKAKQSRQEKGLTAAQISSSTFAGLGALRRRESFRTAYGATSRSYSKTKDFEDATQFMENNPWAKEIFSNDDSLFAFRMAMKGKSHESMKAMLAERGYSGQEAEETIARVQRAKAQIGERAGNIAASRAQAKTGTGFTDAIDMSDEIMHASGGDLNTAARMLAEMRGSALQAGRVDQGGGSFNEHFMAMINKDRGYMMGKDEHGNDKRVAYSRADAENAVLKSVAEAVTPGQAMYGKEQSSALVGKGMALRLQDAYKDKHEAQVVVDKIKADVVAGRKSTLDLDRAQSEFNKADRNVDQHLASALAWRDAAGQSGSMNARGMSDALLNAEVIVDPASGQKGNVFELAQETEQEGKEGFDQTYRSLSSRIGSDLAAEADRARTTADQARTGEVSGTVDPGGNPFP